MQQDATCIAMIAGDAAEDRLGAALIVALRQQRRALRVVGVAGPRMLAQGAASYLPLDKLSLRGREAASGRAWSRKDTRKRLIQQILEARPALFVGVGAAALNLPIERRLQRAGVPTLQYAGPAVWSWRSWRVSRMASYLSHALALYPFEAAAYERAGIPATYIGHPLADSVPLEVDRAAARTQLRLPHGKLSVALMPGDRAAGLPSIAEAFVKAARRFHSEVKEVHFLMPAASRRSRELFESTLRLHADGDLPLTLLFGPSHDALAAADLALVANEAASLEAVLFKTPMIVAQRPTSTLRWWLRRLVDQPYLSLPNRLAGERLVPEFVQHQVTPWALAAALMTLMRDADARRRQTECFAEVHRVLRQDNPARASEVILGLLDHGEH
jgi:lipid-A-disaccharide synthase